MEYKLIMHGNKSLFLVNTLNEEFGDIAYYIINKNEIDGFILNKIVENYYRPNGLRFDTKDVEEFINKGVVNSLVMFGKDNEPTTLTCINIKSDSGIYTLLQTEANHVFNLKQQMLNFRLKDKDKMVKDIFGYFIEEYNNF